VVGPEIGARLTDRSGAKLAVIFIMPGETYAAHKSAEFDFRHEGPSLGQRFSRL
jgi:hypothetical protein